MRRRDLLKGVVVLPAALAANGDVPAHLWQGYEFGSAPPVRERLNQGPFDVDQDQGWQTILFTTPSERQRKRYGTSELIVCISNRGVAGVPGVLWLQLESPDRKLNLRGALDAGHPHGGGIRQASFLLPEGYRGKVQLSAQLEIRPGIKKPVAWACEQPVNADGSITVELKSAGDRGWRRGV